MVIKFSGKCSDSHKIHPTHTQFWWGILTLISKSNRENKPWISPNDNPEPTNQWIVGRIYYTFSTLSPCRIWTLTFSDFFLYFFYKFVWNTLNWRRKNIFAFHWIFTSDNYVMLWYLSFTKLYSFMIRKFRQRRRSAKHRRSKYKKYELAIFQ